METKTIIYLVAFALILRIIVRLISKFREDHKSIEETND